MMTEGTQVDVRTTGTTDASLLRIEGEITSASEKPLMDAYALATEGGAKAIILDFGALDYMNSGGIGLLVTLLVRVQRGGQRLLAVGLNEHYRQIFSLTRLDEAIGIHANEADALAAAGERRAGRDTP
jgi:anti-sigma B factor antagonist